MSKSPYTQESGPLTARASQLSARIASKLRVVEPAFFSQLRPAPDAYPTASLVENATRFFCKTATIDAEGAISKMTSGTPNSIAKNWVRPMVDPKSFRNEQERLGRVWTFLGFTWDATNNGDWFRVALGARSVFVQRFGDQLKGFENRCAHRFYPLRNADKGNGPIARRAACR